MVLSIDDNLIYAKATGGYIKVPSDIVVSLRKYSQNKPHKPEGGGVILGRYILDSLDVVVDKISVPMPGDRATRTTFFRKKHAHQAIIEHEWLVSRQTCTYLGEWHSHPEPIPHPSCIDIFDWKRKLKKDVFDSDSLFFLIVGTSEIQMWQGQKLSKTISLLTLV